MRGAPPSAPASHADDGIIPARAGSTSFFPSLGTATRDHPRSCGEHQAHEGCSEHGAGSSPLVRGALHDLNNMAIPTGIIPARAGST